MVICPVQPCVQKYSTSYLTQITSSSLASRSGRGALAIVTNVGMGCGGRGSVVARGDRRAGLSLVSDRTARRRTALKRTAKPCGPGTRCWCQAGGGKASPTGFDAPSTAGDGDKTNSSPGRARRKPLKPLRAGMPGDPGGPRGDYLVCFLPFAHEASVTGTRHFPAPFLGSPAFLLESPCALTFWRECFSIIRAHRAA
jgi:hypothetical protein